MKKFEMFKTMSLFFILRFVIEKIDMGVFIILKLTKE